MLVIALLPECFYFALEMIQSHHQFNKILPPLSGLHQHLHYIDKNIPTFSFTNKRRSSVARGRLQCVMLDFQNIFRHLSGRELRAVSITPSLLCMVSHCRQSSKEEPRLHMIQDFITRQQLSLVSVSFLLFSICKFKL